MHIRSASSGVATGLAKHLERDYGIHQIRISTPIPGFKVNIYLVESPFPTLIDAPPDQRRYLDELEAGLGRLGYSIEDIRRIIVTHPHFDHFGASKTIAEKSGAEIWVSESGATWLEDYEKELHEVARFRRRLLRQAGASALDIQHMDGYFE
ncbi:MAG: MBL fold metallo-hydrolase, partial [Desulfobacterales bacterium]|nr:MBL fold metallo-hydrolase [Desulfobacterales bacterium]